MESAMSRNKRIDLEVVLARINHEGPGALLTRGEVAALIASRVMDDHDSVRSARNCVGMKLDRSRERGEDVCEGGLACRPDGRFTVDEIARWANREYPGIFADLPTMPRSGYVSVTEELSMGQLVKDDALPGSVEACHELIKQMRAAHDRLLADTQAERTERKRKLVENFKK